MPLQILSGNGALQIMPFRKLGGKCHFFLRFCTRKRSKTYIWSTWSRIYHLRNFVYFCNIFITAIAIAFVDINVNRHLCWERGGNFLWLRFTNPISWNFIFVAASSLKLQSSASQKLLMRLTLRSIECSVIRCSVRQLGLLGSVNSE